MEETPKPPKNWDGHSPKGEAQELEYFKFEQKMEEKLDCLRGICSCCPDSMYYGL